MGTVARCYARRLCTKCQVLLWQMLALEINVKEDGSDLTMTDSVIVMVQAGSNVKKEQLNKRCRCAFILSLGQGRLIMCLAKSD